MRYIIIYYIVSKKCLYLLSLMLYTAFSVYLIKLQNTN